MKILMVLTSHDSLGDTGRKTGFWLEEFAAPYYVFKDAGCDITIASPLGGPPPVDPKSDEPDAQTDATRRFAQDETAREALEHTVRLETLAAMSFDAMFYPGGHGPLWDLTENQQSIALIEAMLREGKPVAAVCHAPGVLRDAKTGEGQPLVAGRAVTGFSNTEEAAVGLSDVVPYLVEDALRQCGARYSKAERDFAPHVQVDGLLVTGQNPASSAPAAQALLDLLAKRRTTPA